MKEFFGSNARLKIRQSGSHIALAPDLKASRKARARWSVGIWKRIVEFANVIYPGEIDAENVIQLVSELDLSRRAPLIWEPEPSALGYGIAEEARRVCQQVENILCWIAKPGEDTERDKLAVKTISETTAVSTLNSSRGMS